MVKEIRIYVEGGGKDSFSKLQIRKGFGEFLSDLQQLARTRGIRLHVIPSGPRTAAFENFRLALRSHSEAFNVLLVDSEQAVSQTPWVHLHRCDGWEALGVPDEHCHLMVQTVEAWIAADPDALGEFYGQGFHRKALPVRKDIEAVEKEHLLEALNRATAKTQKGRYHKILHCSELLGRIRPAVVRQRSRHCERLFAVLGDVLS